MELWQLRQMQALPLEVKIEKSKQRIKEWYEHWDGQVYVSFSGGKDSTVLLHLVRTMYPEVPAVFVDTGLEYPEIKEFVRTVDNVEWLKPKMNFRQVIEKYGYPVISKRQAQYIREIQKPTEKNKTTVRLRLTGIRSNGKFSSYAKIADKWQYLKDAPFKISEKCCKIMKKEPFAVYVKTTDRKPFVGTMASDGQNRELEYMQYGCNAFDMEAPKGRPLSFWMEEDVWNYIDTFCVPYSKIYDMGANRTGCVFCMFGCHLEGSPNRFQRMKITHPQLYNYCMKPWSEGGLGLADVLDYIHVPYGDYMPTLKDYEQMKIEI